MVFAVDRLALALQDDLTQRITATGFAPSNRREPCVMVDLLPGSDGTQHGRCVVPFAGSSETSDAPWPRVS